MSKTVFSCLAGLCLLWFLGMAFYFSALPGGRGLDAALTQAQVLDALDLWSEADKAFHVTGTLYFDSVFPLALTALLLFGLRRYADGFAAHLLSGLTLVYLAADVIENLTTLELLLHDARDWAKTNAWASLVKYLSLILPLIVVLAGLWREWRDPALARE